MRGIKTLFIAIAYRLFGCAALAVVFLGLPIISGFAAMLVLAIVSIPVWHPSRDCYEGVWVATLIVTAVILYYIEFRIRFMTRALDRVGVWLGISRGREKKRC